jgi:hypothetical protein
MVDGSVAMQSDIYSADYLVFFVDRCELRNAQLQNFLYDRLMFYPCGEYVVCVRVTVCVSGQVRSGQVTNLLDTWVGAYTLLVGLVAGHISRAIEV